MLLQPTWLSARPGGKAHSIFVGALLYTEPT